jgi:hypothetical protein
MDPLNEVSTVGGENMRETCARVLAAALMTGAIATVVAMSALFETPTRPARPIAAPPSSLQRPVVFKVQPMRPHRRKATRLEDAHRNTKPAPRVFVAAQRLVTTRTRHVRPQPRRLAAETPKPVPVTAPAPTIDAPAQTPPGDPAPVAALPADKHDSDKEHDHGHGHEGDKSHKEHDGHKD